jgi:hypothetical protein
MSFAKMQEALRAEGWFVEWNMPCCQSCAWAEVPDKHLVGPFKGQEIDLEKVLFNHSQDCELDDLAEMECDSCEGDGMIESSDYDDTEPDEDGNEQYVECDYCAGEGYLRGTFDTNELGFEPDTSVSGFACYPPTQQSDSNFCFDGGKKGVANFNLVYNLIENSGCKILWNGRGDTRPEISW